MDETEEIMLAPESAQFDNGLRVRQRRLTGNPVIRSINVLKTYRDRFEVYLPDYRANTVIVIPRAPGQNIRQAAQAYLAALASQ
ncbi:MAG: hypothetical protein EBR82_57830 [Caulobacteraceae bacterium]|nr:hypothetical protein [Caulobacteraceae bacterium]